MSFNKLVPIFILAAFFILGSSFMVMTMGSVESGSNVSESYKPQFNSTRDASLVTITATKYIAPILGVVGLVIAVVWIGKSTKRSRRW